VQPPDHAEREVAPTIQHFVHAIPTPDKEDEVARLQPALLHVISDGLYRIRQIERVMLPLPGFHQRHQHIESIALRRIAPGIHQPVDRLESAAIVTLGFDKISMAEISNILCVNDVV
jgi:hypothetical protein